MMTPLQRKLWRDIARMKGQVLAVSLVMACGLAMMIMTRSLVYTLESTKDSYYRSHRMAEVFVRLKRAPKEVLDRLAAIANVEAVEGRVVVDVTLDLPGVDEPAMGHIISLPESGGESRLNRLYLREGRYPQVGSRDEVVIGEPFAQANRFQIGDRLVAIINGRREELKICGIGLSPEYVFEAREGDTLPNHRRYSVMWMNEQPLSVAYDMDGAFNDVVATISAAKQDRQVLIEMDRILSRYGGMGAILQKDQASAMRLNDELRVLRSLAWVYPMVFLSVAAFMANAVLARMVRLQREQIAQLKALGYSSRQVGWHYLQLVWVIGMIGSLIGIVAGRYLGGSLVQLYTLFFRFPKLEFCLDTDALWQAWILCMGASVLGVMTVVWQAVRLAPAEAMRPEAPADFRPSVLERIGLTKYFPVVVVMAIRNIERRPWQAAFTCMGLVLATGLMVLPGALSDSVDYLLEHQWHKQQRQDAMVMLIEPRQRVVEYDFKHLPGVHQVEPIRVVPVRMGRAAVQRKLMLTGLERGTDLNRLFGEEDRMLEVPEYGVLISRKLAEVYQISVGDWLEVEVLEGRKSKLGVPVCGLVTDYAGVAAYMEIGALQRMLGEGETINGAYLAVDQQQWPAMMAEVKKTPGVAFLMVKKDQLAAFRETTGKSIGMIRVLYLVLAVIVAVGVVYNSARIALSERGRELATLRVLGFRLGEVRAILVGELSILVAMSIPLGLLFGKGLAIFIMSSFSTETVRMPIRVEVDTYGLAVLVIVLAALASFAVVCRMVAKIDLVSALKARD